MSNIEQVRANIMRDYPAEYWFCKSVNGNYVAIAQELDDVISYMYSSDGDNWETKNIPSRVIPDELAGGYGIVVSMASSDTTIGILIPLNKSQRSLILMTSDGINWNYHIIDERCNQIVALGDELLAFKCGERICSYYIRDNKGRWNRNIFCLHHNVILRYVEEIFDTLILNCVGNDNNRQLFSSKDGIQWQLEDYSVYSRLERFKITNVEEAVEVLNTRAWSTNKENQWFVVTNGNIYVGIQYLGNLSAKFDDGILEYGVVAKDIPDVIHTWIGLAYGNGIFVGVNSGLSGDSLIYSTDGINWEHVRIKPEFRKSITFKDGVFTIHEEYLGKSKYITFVDPDELSVPDED